MPPHPSRPPHPRTDAWACWPHTKWCEEFSPRSFDLGVVHDSLLIVGQHATHAPRLPLARNARLTPRGSNRERSRTSGALKRPAGKASGNWPEISWPEIMNEFLRRGRGTGQREKQGKAQCGHGGWRARLSPLDVQCVFIKNQYRSVLIGSSSPREVCACMCGGAVRCVGVWCSRNTGAHLTNASLSSCPRAVARVPPSHL